MDKAGIGSAINDTTRELGGTLGVDVIGSMSASLYTNALAGSEGLSRSVALAFAVLQLPCVDRPVPAPSASSAARLRRRGALVPHSQLRVVNTIGAHLGLLGLEPAHMEQTKLHLGERLAAPEPFAARAGGGGGDGGVQAPPAPVHRRRAPTSLRP